MEEWAARRQAISNSRYWVSRAGRRGRWRKAPFDLLLTLFGHVLRLTPFYAQGRNNALAVRRVEFDVALPGLPPAFDGYRILHVSDTHFDHLPELVPAARSLVADLQVDMLALTGDVRGRFDEPIERPTAMLMEALGGLDVRGPRLAVLGNHDPVEAVGELERYGFEVLVNRSVLVHRGDDTLRVTGLDDVDSFYTDAARAALRDHEGEFRIALVHSAEVADDADEAGYSLYLCGHTHGGQIALPGGRPMVTHLKRCQHAAVGLWRQGCMIGYTSTGLGVSSLPVRFNTRGEVAIITLHRAERR
jgi:uncharacterized protein